MYCDIHRRNYGGLFGGLCPECDEDSRRQRVDHGLLRDLHGRSEQNAEARERERLEAIRSQQQVTRELEAEAERRYQESVDLERQRLEADEQHRSEMAEAAEKQLRAARDRAEAEEDWRAEERERLEQEQAAREMREGLVCFAEDTQREWLSVSERIRQVWADDERRRQEIAEWNSAAASNRQLLTAWKQYTVIQLAREPVDALTVSPPPGTGRAWQELWSASHALVAQPYLEDRSRALLSVDFSRQNLMALWHLLIRLTGGSTDPHLAHIVKETGCDVTFLDPDLSDSGSGLIGGCALVVLLLCVVAVIAVIVAMLNLDPARAAIRSFGLLCGASFLLALMARIFVAPAARRRRNAAVGALQHAVTGVLRALGSNVHVAAYSYGLEPVFRPLLLALERQLHVSIDFAQLTDASFSDATRGAAQNVLEAQHAVTICEGHLVAVCAQGDSPDVAQLRKQHDSMQQEIRRVGQQVLAGIRPRQPRIRLLRCPACAGPVTSETRNCPYCGSAVIS